MKKNEKPAEKLVEQPVIKAEVLKRVFSTDGPTAKDIIVISKPKGISL